MLGDACDPSVCLGKGRIFSLGRVQQLWLLNITPPWHLLLVIKIDNQLQYCQFISWDPQWVDPYNSLPCPLKGQTCNPTHRLAPEQKSEWSLRSDKLFCIVLRLPKSHRVCWDHHFLYPVEKEEGNDCCYTHFWIEKNCRFLKDLFLKDDNLVVSTTLQTMFPTSPSVLAPKWVPWGRHGTQTCWLEIRESHLQSQHTCISLFEVSQVKDHKSRYGSRATLYPHPSFPYP